MVVSKWLSQLTSALHESADTCDSSQSSHGVSLWFGRLLGRSFTHGLQTVQCAAHLKELCYALPYYASLYHRCVLKIVQLAWHMYDDYFVDVARDREGDLEDIARHGRRRERS